MILKSSYPQFHDPQILISLGPKIPESSDPQILRSIIIKRSGLKRSVLKSELAIFFVPIAKFVNTAIGMKRDLHDQCPLLWHDYRRIFELYDNSRHQSLKKYSASVYSTYLLYCCCRSTLFTNWHR